MAMIEETLNSVLEGMGQIAAYYREGPGRAMVDRPLAPDTHLSQIDALVWELAEALERTAQRIGKGR